MLSVEDVEAYEKMESDIVSLKNEIDILERREALDREMNAAAFSCNLSISTLRK